MSRSDANDPEMNELAAEFGSMMNLLREGPHDVRPETPSANLWESIRSEVQADSVVPASEGKVVSLDDARQRSWGRRGAILTAVAAAILLVGVPLGLAARSGNESTDVLLAAGELGALDSGSASAADLYDTEGNLWLDLETDRSAGADAFLELWLLDVAEDGSVRDLISLGEVDGSGAYDIPDDIDVARFAVVDISVEPDDGNPEHSGDSVVRGGLS